MTFTKLLLYGSLMFYTVANNIDFFPTEVILLPHNSKLCGYTHCQSLIRNSLMQVIEYRIV